MANKELIMKLKKSNEEENVVFFQAGKFADDWSCNLHCSKEPSEASLFMGLKFICARVLFNKPELFYSLRDNKISLNNLYALLEQGFAIRLDEANNSYILIIRNIKLGCSITFSAEKEKGVSAVLKQAEEWATEFVNETVSSFVR